MLHRSKRILMIVLTTLAVPAALLAQERAPAAAPAQPGAPSQQQMQGWVAELQQLQGKLESIQERAMQDPQLRADQETLGTAIRTAMEKADPQLPASMERVETLEAEAVRAQQAGDEATLQRLAEEAQQIQARFLEAQAKVFQEPAMAARIEAFQTRLERKMAEVDAEAPAMIQRFKDLEERLAVALQGMQP